MSLSTMSSRVLLTRNPAKRGDRWADVTVAMEYHTFAAVAKGNHSVE